MAKRKKRKVRQRGTNVYHKDGVLLSDERFLEPSRPVLLSTLRRDVSRETSRRVKLGDDRRFWSPFGLSHHLIDGRPIPRYVPVSDRRSWSLSGGRFWAFGDPKRTIVCERRKRRREALFALGKVGSGRRVSPLRRLNEDSEIICRRR